MSRQKEKPNRTKQPQSKPQPLKPAAARIETGRDYTLYWLIAGVLLVVIAYFPSLSNTAAVWDDNEYLNNPYVRDLSLAGIVKIFSVYFAGNYHPLALLSLGIDRLLGGGTPFIFHLTNLLLHLLNSYLVYLLVKRLTQNNILALLTFFLFGIHTLHVESVAWVAERKDVLYSFFFLLSLVLYTSYAESRKLLHLGLSLLFFLLSLLSKGQAVVLVAILPFVDYLKGRRWQAGKILSEKIPFLILSLIFAWIAVRAQESAQYVHFDKFPFPQRFAFASYGLAQYLIKSVVPTGLSALYPYPAKLAGGGIPSWYWFYTLTIPLFFICSYFLIKRSKIYLFGLGLFFIGILPLLQFIPVGGAIMADRYFYIPSAGLLLCFACGFLELKNTTIRYSLFILFTLVLSGLTFSRTMVWKDNLTLWTDEIHKNESYQVGYYNRGLIYSASKDWDKAMADFSTAIAIDPNYADALYSRGLAYDNAGQYNMAIADYSGAIGINPDLTKAWYNRGMAYGKMGQMDKAIADCSKAIEIDPQCAEAYSSRGVAWLNMSQWDKAIADFTTALSIDPKSSQSYENRAVAFLNLREAEKALADCSEAIGIDPGNARAYNTRGFTYSLMGQYEKATEDYSKAIGIDPRFADAYNNRGIAGISLGQWDKAIADFSSVITINPNYVKAYFNRAYVYGKTGQWGNAVADYSRVLDLDPGNTTALLNRQKAQEIIRERGK